MSEDSPVSKNYDIGNHISDEKKEALECYKHFHEVMEMVRLLGRGPDRGWHADSIYELQKVEDRDLVL